MPPSDSWIWPLLGLVFLPWTTIMYVLAWGPVYGVSGAGWILVALGVFFDLASYSARAPRPLRHRLSGLAD